jgi:hypothetical protein
MAQPEASLWKYLKTVLPSRGHYSRIESDTSPGFPDIHYTLLNHSGTIELKSAGFAPFGKKGLRKSQIDWMAEEDNAGGVIWIIAEVQGWVYLINGNTFFEEFNQMDKARLLEVSDYSWVRGRDLPTDELHARLAESNR